MTPEPGTTRIDPELAQRLVAEAQEPLGLLDGEGRVLWLNAAGERALGPAAAGRRLATLASAETPEDLEAALERVLSGEPAEVRVVAGVDGAPRRWRLALHPLGADDPGGARAMLSGCDTTEVEGARQAEAQLTATLERLGASASMIAHDIKNPLTALHLALSAVAHHLGEDELGLIEDLARRFERLERTLRRTIGYARPLELRRVRVGLDALLEGALGGFAEELAARGARLERRLEPGLELEADPTRLAEALQALVRNALEARDGPVQVRVGAWRTPEGLALFVEDDGPGILPSVRASLFRPFVSTKAESSGLGLPAALRVVEAHGGGIEAGPGELGGARFTIHLPLGGKPT